ncbi:POK9 protein, partial [Chaetorhynchus papuensis]|nr:POK9 protein [Chaetorhynchus papuensis]
QHNGLSPQVKRGDEREKRWPRQDTSCRRSLGKANNGDTNTPPVLPRELRPATFGSLGLDLAASVDVVLHTSLPQLIPTNIKGPIQINGHPVGALLLGRSSTTMKGLFVLPGVIDADYKGDIQIMAYAQVPPLQIHKGQQIAQLLPFPPLMRSILPWDLEAIVKDNQSDKSFVSTSDNLACVMLDLNNRPQLKTTISYQGESISIKGLLDTGADSSVISSRNWPPHWPAYPSTATVTGVGGMTLAHNSPIVQISLEKTSTVITTTLAIVNLPPSVPLLIGRNILAQLGLHL